MKTTTTRFALVDTYNQCTLRYRTAKYGNGHISLQVFDTQEEAQRELYHTLAHNNQVTFKELATEQELFAQDPQDFATFEEYAAKYFTNGEGWYDQDGNFLGTENDLCINLGDNRLQIEEVTITKTTEVDEDNEDVTYHITGRNIDYTCDEDEYKRFSWV